MRSISRPLLYRSPLLLFLASLFACPVAKAQVTLSCNLQNKPIQVFHLKLDSELPSVYSESSDGQYIKQGKPIIAAEKIIFVNDVFLTELRRWYSSAQVQQAENSNNDAAIASLLDWRRRINQSEAENTIVINRINLSVQNGEGKLLGRCNRTKTPKTVF